MGAARSGYSDCVWLAYFEWHPFYAAAATIVSLIAWLIWAVLT
jgi:hypothetical protein